MRWIFAASNLSLFSLLCSLTLANIAAAADIDVVGLFPGKAVLVVDGGSPKTYAIGKTIAGSVKLVAVTDTSATFEDNGKRQTIQLGGHVNRSTAPSGITSVTLQGNGQGHYLTQGQINGGSIRFLVDTGATYIALSTADATRLGISYRNGKVGMANTANGQTRAYHVKLDTVKIGDIVLNQVDAMVLDSGLPFALLGMSFLSRMEMRRDGEQMTLTKRY